MNQEVNEYARLKSQLASAKSLIRSMGDDTPKKDWGLKAIAAGLQEYIKAVGENKVINDRPLTTEEFIEGNNYYYDLAKKQSADAAYKRVMDKAKKGLELKKQYEQERNNPS